MHTLPFLLTLLALLVAPLLAQDAPAAQQPMQAAQPLEIEPLGPEPTLCARRTVAGDSVSVHYIGMLGSPQGNRFDESYRRGAPLRFALGHGQVIRGWDEGLRDMCVGEKRRLTVQPEWAYGAKGAGGIIPPNSVLGQLTAAVRVRSVADSDQSSIPS